MRGRTLLCGLTLAAALAAGGEASACNYVSSTFEIELPGPKPSARDIAERERGLAREAVRNRRARAEAALAGGADAAAELAKLLVPNLRPVWIERDGCGRLSEMDAAGAETIEDWLQGTYLAGHAASFEDLREVLAGPALGPGCNAEFRDRFAFHLRRRLDARRLRSDYLFLASHPFGADERVRRLIVFRDRGRRPPALWIDRELARWARRERGGRPLQRVIDEFWREAGPQLDDAALACPAAAARWAETQARVVARIEAAYPEQTALLRRPER